MRLAYVDSALPVRSELSTAAVDAEWLAGVATEHDVLVVVDQHGPGPDLLMDSGVEVIVSAKRGMDDPAAGRISAEHALYGQLADRHRAAPFDMIVSGTAVTTDPTWYEPELSGVPQVGVLGGGIIESLRLVVDDAHLAVRHGRELWATASRLAGYDALLGRVPPDAFGLGAVFDSVPRLAPGPVPELHTDAPAGIHQAVVVALTEDRAGLGSIVRRVADRIGMGTATSLIVIVPDVAMGDESTGALVMTGCPEHLRTSVIVVPPGGDGAAAAFLATSDLIVAARPADLAVNAVGDAAAAGTPLILLEGARPDPGAAFRPPMREVRKPGERVLVPFDGGVEEAARVLSAARDAEYAVLHTTNGAPLAVRMASTEALAGHDVVVVGQASPITGQPAAGMISPDVLAIHRDGIASILRRMTKAATLWDVVASTLSLTLADRVRLGILPAPVGVAGRAVPPVAGTDLPGWIGGVDLIPRLDLSRAAAIGAPQPSGPAGSDGASVRDWVKTHRWSDRARLALPWKWGVLGRAMKGRW